MSLPDRLSEDRLARERALAVASFIVEAPAGAGKTELLTQRYLRLLAVVEHPEEVLALTFTNKAATEMRDRILRSLETAASGVLPEEPHKQLTFRLAGKALEQDAERAWGLLEHPGRLRITTLDALCASLARQMPYLSRFGSQPGVAEDAEAHYATAARHTLEMVEAGGSDADVVAGALAFMDNNAGRLENLLIAMLGKRDQWLHHASRIESGEMKGEVEAGFAALIERDLATVGTLFNGRMQSLLMPLARFAAANVPGAFDAVADWSAPLRAGIDDLARWQAVAGLLLTGTGTVRKTVDKRCGFPADKEFADQKKAMLELLADVRATTGLEEALGVLPSLPQPQLSEAEWATVECFSRLLRLAAGQLWLAFQEAGEVDFIEIAARASLALGDDEAPTDLAQALDYRIRHLLVDEFQDTSPTQVGLIEKLTRGWIPDDGRTLFVVGDPMQSIYRFRKADVGLFLRVRERGIGDIRLEHLRLFRNNRSYPGIVDWVNAAFPGIFPAEDWPETGAVRYAESAATKAARDDSGVVVHPVIERDAGNDVADDEARQVLALIRQARQEAPDKSVAVLVRARRHLDALVAEIRRSAPDLRFQAVDIEGLDGRQHVQDLLTLFRALHHRADRVHWLALLRAPWCGLKLVDLHALAGDDRQSTVWQLMQDEGRLQRLSDDGQQRLRQVRAVLECAFSARHRQHPRRWLEGVWLMLGGPRCLEAPESLDDVAAFFALVDRLVAARSLSPETLATHAAELFAPADPQGEAVQMMTIHKSKGLEFDTVILPGLHRETGGGESNLLLWDEVAGADGAEHLLVAPMRQKGSDKAEPTAYDTLRRLETERAAHETERLLYVAATRAIRRLHLVGIAQADERKDDGLKLPATGTLLKLLWPGIAQPVFVAALAGASSALKVGGIDPATFVPPLLRLRQPAIPDALRTLPAGLPAADNPLAFDVAESGLSLEASIGTLVHRCLELVAGQGLERWSVERAMTARPAYRRWLENRGHATEEATQGAEEVAAALARTLDSGIGRWLLSAHPEAASEQAWSSTDGGQPSQHVIDRSFVADGCRWIVDYKTARLPENELPQRAESYRPQLERYVRLFVGEPLLIRAAIYFPLQGKLIELPLG